VKIRFGKVGYPLYCDAGPCEGDMRIDLTIRLYLSPEEYARYEGSDSLQIHSRKTETDAPGPAAPPNLPGNYHPATSWRRATCCWRPAGPPAGSRSPAR
jgi:hypothetical protein